VQLITTTATGKTEYIITIPSGVEFLRIGIAKQIAIESFIGQSAVQNQNLHKFKNLPSTCMTAFYEKMNAKAARIGMANSSFVSASGLTKQNFITAKDQLKMMIEACSYDALLKVWDRDSWSIDVGKENPVNVTSSVASTALSTYYTLLGGKTGTLDYGSGDLQVVNVCAVCANSYGDVFIGVIVDATSDSARWTAMKELMDIATAVKHTPNYDVSSASVAHANSAIVCELPKSPAMWQTHTPIVLFAQNENVVKAPASTTKVMTIITALDYLPSLWEKVEIVSEDIEAGSGNYFSAGDKITVEDLLFAMMLPSSNTCAIALARLAGDYILSI
jgi:D-alanyl-D-alanine carboxypeptidase